MSKLMLILAVAASAVTLAPVPAAAAPCTDAYMSCLNDSYQLKGVLRTMADIECFASYTGCVAREIRLQ